MGDTPRLRRTPDDPWLSTRMHHSAAIGQRELALTDAFAAATSLALTRLRALVLPTPESRPMLPDPAVAQQVFDEACAEFVPDITGDTWWAAHGQEFVSGVVPSILANLQRVLSQAASDPSVSMEQERAAALAMLHLGGGELPALTAAGDTPESWNVKWVKAWQAWDKVADLDDASAVARGHQRVAEALLERLKKTSDSALKTALQGLIDKRLAAAASVNPAAAKLTAAIDQFNKASSLVGVVTGKAPFPGQPSKPISTAPAGQKNYYTRSQRAARSATVSSYNQQALDRARDNAVSSDTRLVKTWLATADARTRDDHEEADGQQVGLDEPFIVGGEELDYPGDPNGSDEQVINCRCTFITEEAASSGDQGDDGGNLLALTAAQEASTMTLPTGWSGVLAPLDTVSGDGREISTPPAALRLRQAPIPFMWQRESAEEHGQSVIVGRVDEAWVENGNLMGRGTFDLENPDAAEAARQLGAGFASRVSVDLDDVTVDFREDPEAPPPGEDDLLYFPEGTLVCTDWRLAGATMVGVSAFDEAIITAVYGDAASPAASGGGTDGMSLMFADSPAASGGENEIELEVGDVVELDDPDAAGTTVQGTVTAVDATDEANPMVTVSLPASDGSADARLVTVPLADVTLVPDAEDIAEGEGLALVASGMVAPLNPPREWFANPSYGLGGDDQRLQPLVGQPGAYAAPLTIDDDGRISGHMAAWGTCHTGLPGCTTPPSSRSGYASFLLGETVLADGGRVSTGTLTFDTGHADIRLDARSAVRHYDDTGTAFATVTVGEDIYGIWVAGALLPDVKPQLLPRLRASKLSGDWRGGELRAALAVNSPGFPVMRARSNTLADAPLALVASGVPNFGIKSKARQRLALTPEMITAVAKEIEKRSSRRSTAAQLGRRMNKIKAQQLAARVTKEN